MALLESREDAQKKITETIVTLQEQRNSALDALVNATAELKIATAKLESVQKQNTDLSSLLETFKENNKKLSADLEEHNQKFKELQEAHEKLLKEHEKMKSMEVPKVSKKKVG